MKYHVPLTAKIMRDYRRIKGYTREQLAAKIGLSENYIYKIEKEISPILSESEEVIRRKLGLTDAAIVKFEALAEAING